MKKMNKTVFALSISLFCLTKATGCANTSESSNEAFTVTTNEKNLREAANTTKELLPMHSSNNTSNHIDTLMEKDASEIIYYKGTDLSTLGTIYDRWYIDMQNLSFSHEEPDKHTGILSFTSSGIWLLDGTSQTFISDQNIGRPILLNINTEQPNYLYFVYLDTTSFTQEEERNVYYDVFDLETGSLYTNELSKDCSIFLSEHSYTDVSMQVTNTFLTFSDETSSVSMRNHTLDTFEGTPLTELSESQIQTYGMFCTNELKTQIGKLTNISIYDKDNAYGYLDLDLDGTVETIRVYEQTLEDNTSQYTLELSSCFDEQSYFSTIDSTVLPSIYAINIDGSHTLLAIQTEDIYHDPSTYFFYFYQNDLIASDPLASSIENISFSGNEIATLTSIELLQTDSILCDYTFDAESGKVEISEQSSYLLQSGLDGQTISLEKNLNVYPKPKYKDAPTIVSPQTVTFTKVDSSLSWVYLEASDGTSGWFHIPAAYRIDQYNCDASEIFSGLLSAN